VVILMSLHMLESDIDTWERTVDAADGSDKVSMSNAAGSEFLGLLGLMKCPLVVTAHNNRTSDNLMEGAKAFDRHQEGMKPLQLSTVSINLSGKTRNMCNTSAYITLWGEAVF